MWFWQKRLLSRNDHGRCTEALARALAPPHMGVSRALAGVLAPQMGVSRALAALWTRACEAAVTEVQHFAAKSSNALGGKAPLGDSQASAQL